MDIQQFGATIKSKYPQYKDYSDEEIGRRMLEKYPQYKDRVSTKQKEGVLSSGSNLLRKLGLGIVPDAAATVTNIPNMVNVADPQKYKEGFKNNPFVDQEVIEGVSKGDTKKFRENAADNAQAFSTILGLISGGGVARSGTRAVLHPKATVGGMIEKKAEKAGEVSNELLEKFFGTLQNPNKKLIEKIGAARDQGKLLRLLQGEIATQGRGPGGVVNQPTFSEMLNRRIGIGKKAYEGSSSTIEKSFDKSLQRAYSQVLKEGAGTGKLDKLFSLLSGIEKTGKSTLPYGVGGAVGFIGLNYLLSKLNRN